MKNTIITTAIILAASMMAKSQTIDTTFKAFPSCKTVAFLNNPRTDTVNVSRIMITRCSIDFAFHVMSIDYTFSKLDGTAIYTGYCTLNAIQYGAILAGVQADLPVIFQQVGIKLGITYQ